MTPRHLALDVRAACSRRAFIARSAVGGAAAAVLPAAAGDKAAVLRPARRPRPPYRVWFQPRYFERNLDLFAHMTIDASGWIDPRLAELAGKTTLDWVYGPNHPSTTGPDYWRRACSASARAWPRRSEAPAFVSAGIAVDEWVPPPRPENVPWFCEGLRAGRKENPDVFIAVWSTDPGPPLLELGNDGTVDLMIVEGYTHSVEKGQSTSWENALRRCDAFAKAGLEAKTIFSFGHITDRPDHRGGRLRGAWLRERMLALKERYPAMPGTAFFQPADPDTPELRELILACDRLSAEFWPDAPAA